MYANDDWCKSARQSSFSFSCHYFYHLFIRDFFCLFSQARIRPMTPA